MANHYDTNTCDPADFSVTAVAVQCMSESIAVRLNKYNTDELENIVCQLEKSLTDDLENKAYPSVNTQKIYDNNIHFINEFRDIGLPYNDYIKKRDNPNIDRKTSLGVTNFIQVLLNYLLTTHFMEIDETDKVPTYVGLGSIYPFDSPCFIRLGLIEIAETIIKIIANISDLSELEFEQKYYDLITNNKQKYQLECDIRKAKYTN
jgi:hypothetical protein